MSLPLPLSVPLITPRDLAAPIAWRHGQAISAGQFLAQAQWLAQQLPAGRPINLCQDRLHFALGLAAALLRGQTSLLPPNALPETLQQLPADAEQGPAYALIDDDTLALGSLPVHRVQLPPQPLPPFSDASQVPHISASAAAVCLLTSGSTGAPQPHSKSWGSLATNIAAEATRLAHYMGLPHLAGVTVVATVPAQHSYGLESSVLLALLGGASFEAGRPFFPADISNALAAVPRPRALVTTPFHLKTLLGAAVPVPEVDLVLSATAPLSPQLAAQAQAALSGPVAEIYGCTEAGQVASRITTQGEDWLALGELQFSREDTPEGERFSVVGGHVLQATPLADVLVLQSSRQFKLLGRANDLIHVAGKRSSLAHLNFHLNRIPGVLDGAFWLPDETGHGVVRPVAFVVAPSLTAAQITRALRGQLEAAFVPRRVLHVQALPREATGKLTAAALRSFALAQLAQLAAPDSTTIAADHPTFAGHFPGHPVLPGVALLSLVMQAVAAQPTLQALLGATPQIDNAKFLTPVLPGSLVRVLLREQGRGVAFEVVRVQADAPDTVAARGQLSPAAALNST
jgi:acyl-CoA synthetase (AMP-forming)/AMP-acid ligase II/3-hydroxymyristoyl/3-hydroxydecanoyl-(acyl carrier protein) dehydratase